MTNGIEMSNKISKIPDEVLREILPKKAEEVWSIGKGIFPLERKDPFWKTEEREKFSKGKVVTGREVLWTSPFTKGILIRAKKPKEERVN